jgi:hypothetical protein
MSNQEEYTKGVLARTLPALVLMTAFGSFVALAIYAYKSGQNSTTAEGELLVIEADKSPMKEKPADPGGMEFPNKDKTIYDTFSAGNSAPAQVERVLPTPEEPIAKDVENAEPATWINGKLVANDSAASPAKNGAESVFAEEKPAEPKVVNVNEELGKQAVAEDVKEVPVASAATTKPVELQTAAPKVVAETKVAVKAEPKIEPKAEVKVAEKPAVKPAISGKQLAQLGAYKTESEAKADFAKMQKKFSVLSGLSPVVNRADLGDKGIFYRLRVATSDAKSLCAKLAGQACMAVK